MDTLLLLALTGLIFYRLWTILGMRNGAEKPRNDWSDTPFNDKNTDDNIIILPHKNKTQKESEESNENIVLKNNIELLHSKDPTFQEESFLRGAVRAFEKIVIAYAQGDVAQLKHLVTTPVLEKFTAAIEQRSERGERLEAEVDDVLPSLIDIKFDDEQHALISVQFQSEQMLATIDADGQNLDNPALLKTIVIDTWTFIKKLDDAKTSRIWLLAKTEVKPL